MVYIFSLLRSFFFLCCKNPRGQQHLPSSCYVHLFFPPWSYRSAHLLRLEFCVIACFGCLGIETHHNWHLYVTTVHLQNFGNSIFMHRTCFLHSHSSGASSKETAMDMQCLCPLSSFSAFTKGRKNVVGLRVCSSACSGAPCPQFSLWPVRRPFQFDPHGGLARWASSHSQLPTRERTPISIQRTC